MCGIGGILRVHPPGSAPPPPERSIPEAWLDILDESIKHRGPDGQGRFRDRAVRADGSVVDVALVHRRLSILDHAGGAQPMVSVGRSASANSVATFQGMPLPVLFHGKPKDEVRYRPLARGGASEDRGQQPAARNDLVAVVFNGCIYNHRELRKELQAAGHVFESDHSDTEVLVHGWREWEWRLTARLEGMYAFVLWNRSTAELVFARDGFGEKPLYELGIHEKFSAACSAVPGLIRLRAVTADSKRTEQPLYPQMLKGWIQFGWNQNTPFHDITTSWTFAAGKLGDAPFDGGSCSHANWIDLAKPGHEMLSPEKVDHALRSAVRDRLDADVPTGCFLSGGIDSALIARYASEIDANLGAFTVRMPSSEYDESDDAGITARHLGVRHHILDCNPNPTADLISAIYKLGLPFGDSSLLPALWVSRAAKSAVGVALSGDGGDELFMGYDRHRVMRPLANLEKLPRHTLLDLVPAVVSGGSMRSRSVRLMRLLNAAAHGGFQDLVAIFPSEMTWALGISERDRYGWSAGVYLPSGDPAPRGEPSFEDWVWRTRRFEIGCYLPEDLLRKSDTASMSVALELRAPFLDRRVAKPAINASVASLMPRNQRKGLLRAVARKYFPAEIVDRPKQGFAIPVGEWFRSDYGGMRQLLLDHLGGPEPFGPDSLGINGMINMNFVTRMLKEHDDAGVKSVWPWKGRDHSQRLYMLLVLSIWAKWLGGLGGE